MAARNATDGIPSEVRSPPLPDITRRGAVMPTAKAHAWLTLALAFGCAAGRAGGGEPPTAVMAGSLPSSWYAGGPTCSGEPRLRVHRYTADFYILRQPACTNFEKPFLFLLFGDRRALLLDTGAGHLDVAITVDSLVADWRSRHAGRPAELVVAHSHGHGDHTAGDSAFANRPGVTLVARDSTSVHRFFGLESDRIGSFDLGGRVLDVVPIPGHQPASIALYDRRTGVLLTGDSFYPGRLYVRDSAAFVRSIDRLVQFTARHPVTHLLGTHIENTSRPGIDYPEGTVDQPDEHVLELAPADLVALDSALRSMRGRLVRTVMPHFTIWPVPAR